MMKLQIERHPNPALRSFHAEVALSASDQLLLFTAPLPSRPRENDFRKFRLAGATGEMLARELCKISGVIQIFLDRNHVGIAVRENSHISWQNLEPQIFGAFQRVFPSEERFEWILPPPVEGASASPD